MSAKLAGKKRPREVEGGHQKKGIQKKESDPKKRKKERQLKKKGGELLLDTKKLWEEVRRKDLTKDERRQRCMELLDLCRGKMLEIICKHDGSRVLQSLMKFGTGEQREEIMNELSGKIVPLAKSPYAKHLVVTMLRYGSSETKEKILKEFHGRVRKLVRHRDAAPVLEFAYTTAANGAQRRSLLAEFYGPQYALFHSGRPLDGLFQENPELKAPIVRDVGVVVRAVLEKGLLSHSIVHRILLDYLTYMAPSEIKDMTQTLRDHVVHILHTKEGAQIGSWCVTYGSPKDRKAIIKSFKSFALKIALEEYGHLVLLRLIDVTDDTVLVRKALYGELMRNKEELLQVLTSRTGRLVFLLLLAPNSPRYFPQEVIKHLQPAFFPNSDPSAPAVPVSKKEPETRRKELLDGLLPDLLSLLLSPAADDDSPSLLRSLITSQFGNFVVLELSLHLTDDSKEKLLDALAQAAAGDNNELLDDFVASRFYKRLIKLAPGFGSTLLPVVERRLLHWAQQKESAHVVLALLGDAEHTAARVRADLSPHKDQLPARLHSLLSSTAA